LSVAMATVLDLLLLALQWAITPWARRRRLPNGADAGPDVPIGPAFDPILAEVGS
jgi:hypothetical protein